jgi:hypothetical protein
MPVAVSIVDQSPHLRFWNTVWINAVVVLESTFEVYQDSI